MLARGRMISAMVLLAALGPAAWGAEPVEPAKLIQNAVAEVGYRNFEGARDLFDQALRAAPPQGLAWQQAMFGKAICLQQLSPATEANISAAQKLFQQLADACPDSPYAPRALFQIARIIELDDLYTGDKADLDGSRPWYQKIIDRWPNEPIAGEATLRLAGTYVQKMEKADCATGAKLLEDWLAAHPKEELAPVMWQYLGDTYFYPLDDYANAVRSYVKADELGLLEKGREGPVYWRTAVLAQRLMDKAKADGRADEQARYRALAVGFYSKLIIKAPNSGKGWEAQQRLKALGAPVPAIKVFESVEAATSQTAEGGKDGGGKDGTGTISSAPAPAGPGGTR